MAGRVGGVGHHHAATPEDQEIANKVKGAVEAKLASQYAEYVVTQVATQVVAGTNFFMKVNVGGGHFIHIRVFRGLPPQQHLELNNAQAGHTADDELAYF